MTKADLSTPKPARFGIAVVVVVLHVVAISALIRALAPDLTARVAEEVISAFTVTVTTSPPPEPTAKAPEPEGTAAPAGQKAKPREDTAPKPKVAIAKKSAPPVASTGSADTSGARDQGDGTGAGGAGSGTGAGGSGTGSGAAGAAKAVKIAGDINSRRDYPRASEDARIGTEVIIYLTVGTDGRARNCRVQKPGGDPASDQITCRLALERFRFRPATDASGNPVESTYGWRQRWFYPGKTS